MSNEKLLAYKELYSKYIDYAVILHNYHYTFLNHMGLETGKTVRSALKHMIRLERQLQKASWEAYDEHRENLREQKRLKKQAQEYRKLHPLKRGRKPKNGNNNSTTSKTV